MADRVEIISSGRARIIYLSVVMMKCHDEV